MDRAKRLRLSGAVLLLAVAVVGCRTEPRINARDKASLDASLRAMGASMSPDERERLTRDVAAITASEGVGLAFHGKDPDAAVKAVHGMTAAEIHAKAAAVREDWRQDREPFPSESIP